MIEKYFGIKNISTTKNLNSDENFSVEIPTHDETSFLEANENLIRDVIDEKFLGVDEEKVIEKYHKRKPTNFERNDRRKAQDALINKAGATFENYRRKIQSETPRLKASTNSAFSGNYS